MTTNQAARERLGNQTGHHIAVALLVVVYALVLAGVYEFVVSPRFTYLAFVSVEPDLVLVLWDAILCGILALLLPGSVSKPSELGRILVFFFVTVPALVIPTFLSEVWTATLVETKLYGVVAFLLLSGVLVLFDHRGSPLKIPGDTALYALLGVALVAVVLLGSSYGFSIQIHALTDVYSQREIYSAGGGGRGVVGLAAGLLQNVLAPIFLVVGMHRRSMLYFSVGLMLSLYIYTITGLKSALIGVAFVTAIYWLARRTNATTFARGWSLGAIAFVVGAWVVSSTPVFSTAIDLVVRRILTMQGLLTYNYVRIFGEEQPTYFTHTILGSMAAERFDGSPPKSSARSFSAVQCTRMPRSLRMGTWVESCSGYLPQR